MVPSLVSKAHLKASHDLAGRWAFLSGETKMPKQHCCIEPDCDKEVSGEGRRCVQCAARNPERRAKVSKGVEQAWINGVYGEEWQQKQSQAQKDAHTRGA